MNIIGGAERRGRQGSSTCDSAREIPVELFLIPSVRRGSCFLHQCRAHTARAAGMRGRRAGWIHIGTSHRGEGRICRIQAEAFFMREWRQEERSILDRHSLSWSYLGIRLRQGSGSCLADVRARTSACPHMGDSKVDARLSSCNQARTAGELSCVRERAAHHDVGERIMGAARHRGRRVQRSEDFQVGVSVVSTGRSPDQTGATRDSSSRQRIERCCAPRGKAAHLARCGRAAHVRLCRRQEERRRRESRHHGWLRLSGHVTLATPHARAITGSCTQDHAW